MASAQSLSGVVLVSDSRPISSQSNVSKRTSTTLSSKSDYIQDISTKLTPVESGQVPGPPFYESENNAMVGKSSKVYSLEDTEDNQKPSNYDMELSERRTPSPPPLASGRMDAHPAQQEVNDTLNRTLHQVRIFLANHKYLSDF